MYTKLLTKQPEQLQVLLIHSSIDRNNLRTEIWTGLKTSAHVEGAYTIGQRFGGDIELAHIWDKEVYLGHRTGAHVGAVDTLATELYYGSSLLCS